MIGGQREGEIILAHPKKSTNSLQISNSTTKSSLRREQREKRKALDKTHETQSKDRVLKQNMQLIIQNEN